MRRNPGRYGLLTDRFSLLPLLSGTLRKVRDRATDDEKPDWVALAVLVVLPISIGASSAGQQIALAKPDQLIAGFALLAGSLLAAFGVLATWRERIEGADVRTARLRIDEAVGHTLLAAVASILGAAVMVVLSNLPDDRARMHVFKVALSSVGIALGIFVVLAVLVIANLTWDAYEHRTGTPAPTKRTRKSL